MEEKIVKNKKDFSKVVIKSVFLLLILDIFYMAIIATFTALFSEITPFIFLSMTMLLLIVKLIVFGVLLTILFKKYIFDNSA